MRPVMALTGLRNRCSWMLWARIPSPEFSALQTPTLQDQEGDWEDSWPAYPAESHVQSAATDQPKGRFRTVGDWLTVAFVVVWVVLFGLPAFLIVVLDAHAS